MHNKFVEQLNREQSVPVDNKVGSLTVQCNLKVLEKTEIPEIKNGIWRLIVRLLSSNLSLMKNTLY